MGPNYELLHWDVIFTMFTTAVGLVAFAAALERYFIRKATWLETILFGVAAAGLFWTELWADVIGWITFAVVVLLQKFYKPSNTAS
jgi:TRAP-type uncharacterized transport system fused permease subunit